MTQTIIDLSGESLTLPEDLSGLLVEESGFLSRPCILPDELRGALLLPSDDSGSVSAGPPYESSLARDDGQCEDDDVCGGSPLSRGSWEGAAGSATPDRRRASELLEDADSPVPSTAPSVGLGGARDASSSLSQSSKSNKSRDWSLSDTDLRELLERNSGLDLTAMGTNSLTSVPELLERAERPCQGGVEAGEAARAGEAAAHALPPGPKLLAKPGAAAPPPPSPATSGTQGAGTPATGRSGHSEPVGSQGAGTPATGRSGHSDPVEGSPPTNAGARSQGTSASGSPPISTSVRSQGTSARSHATAWSSARVSSAHSPSLASGPTLTAARELS